MTPPPPNLAKRVPLWRRAELLWITKNGIRMTGMPGAGPTHTDEELWSVVAFLEQLPKLSPAAFKALGKGTPVSMPTAPAGPGQPPGH